MYYTETGGGGGEGASAIRKFERGRGKPVELYAVEIPCVDIGV